MVDFIAYTTVSSRGGRGGGRPGGPGEKGGRQPAPAQRK
jgi:hypothetical protein